MKHEVRTHMQQLAEQVFPDVKLTFGRSYDEWNGLSSSDRPQHVVDSFVSKSENDREFFLLNVDGCNVLLRICDAMEGSGYDKFVVVHDSGILSSNEQVVARYTRWAYHGV